MYEKYEMNSVLFNRRDVFADLGLASDANENGEGTTVDSVNPGTSDK